MPMGVHTYLKSLDEDPTPQVAAFLLMRQAHWYYFGSTGWLDDDWAWSPLYDQLARCGKPLGDAKGAPAPVVYTREYEHCHVSINCTDTSKEGCDARLVGPSA